MSKRYQNLIRWDRVQRETLTFQTSEPSVGALKELILDSIIVGIAASNQEIQVANSTGVQLFTGGAASAQEIQESEGTALQIFLGISVTNQEPQEGSGTSSLNFIASANHEQEPNDQDAAAYNGTLIYGNADHEQESQSEILSGSVSAKKQHPVLFGPAIGKMGSFPRKKIDGYVEQEQPPQLIVARGFNGLNISGKTETKQEINKIKSSAWWGYSGAIKTENGIQLGNGKSILVTAEDELIKLLDWLDVA